MNSKLIAILASVLVIAMGAFIALPADETDAADGDVSVETLEGWDGWIVITVPSTYLGDTLLYSIVDPDGTNIVPAGASAPVEDLSEFGYSSSGMLIQVSFEEGVVYTITVMTSAQEVVGTYTYGDVSGGDDEDATLESIAVTTLPDKTEYTVGETFDPTGMVVTAYYSDDTTGDVTEAVEFDATLTEGQTAVEISYTEDDVTVTTEVAVTVSPATGGGDDDTPVTPTDMEEITVTGTYYSQLTRFTNNQVVIVDGTLTIYSGASIYIEGQLVVPAGATIIIEEGGELHLEGNAVGVDYVAEIDGTVTVEEGGLLCIDAGTATVGGSVDIYGDMDVTDGLEIETDGIVTVGDTGSLDAVDGTVTVRGELDVNGVLVASEVDNHGTIVFDSEMPSSGDVTIYMMASGATVQITTFTSNGGRVTITDSTLVFRGTGDNEVNVGNHDGTYANSIVIGFGATTGSGSSASDVGLSDVLFAEFSGLTVTEGVSSTGSGSNARYTNYMDVSGSMAVSTVYDGDGTTPTANATVTLSADGSGRNYVAVSGTVTVGSNVTVDNQATLNVSGTVTATSGTLGNTGEVTLQGEGAVTVLTSRIGSFEAGVVNATKYASGSNTVYVTIDTALATVAQDGNTITQLTLLGSNTVTVSAVLPSGVVMQTAESTLNIGERNGSDVVLTVASGASVRGSAEVVQVNGTLYAENKSNIQSSTQETIVADVYSEETDEDGKAVRNGWAKWTNIYTAMAEAQEGDVVEVFKDSGYVDLTASLTVPEGVTLVVGEDKAALLLRDGVTLTVNGTLQTYIDVYAETRFGSTAVNITGGEATSAIVVNGYLEAGRLGYADSVEVADAYAAISDGAPIAGAYYEYDAWNVISPLALAVALSEDIDGTITVYGAVSAGDVVFTAADDCETILVASTEASDDAYGITATSLTVGSLTLDGATLVADGAITGTIVAGDAYLQATSVNGITVDDDDGMVVSGTAYALGTVRNASVTLTAGSANAGAADANAVFLVPVTVSADAVLTSVGAEFSELTVSGTLEIATGSRVDADTVTVQDGGAVNVEANETFYVGNAYVYGTLAIAEGTTTSNPGVANIGTLGIGISAEDVSKGVAGTSGTIEGATTSVTEAYVSSSATVSDAMLSALEVYYPTTFQVEGSAWFVYYGDEFTAPGAAPVENAVLLGWTDEDSNSYDRGYTYDADEERVLTAVVDYDIYNIVVTADAGIGSVAIDGVVLVNLGNMFVTTSPIAAGSHSVTYTLKSGYEGSATLSSGSSYASVSGLTFTLSGMDDDSYTTVQLSLSGTTASDSSIIVNVDSGSGDGLGLTDILLIVLVILIVVMAIIVALRLMRS